MKKFLLILSLCALGGEAVAAKDIYRCATGTGDSRHVLRIYESAVGKYGYRYTECGTTDCEFPSYESSGPIDRETYTRRPIMTFSKGKVGLHTIFSELYFNDGNVSRRFRRFECVVQNPDDTGLIVGISEMDAGPCSKPSNPFDAAIRELARNDAEAQCPKGVITQTQDYKIVDNCLDGKRKLYASALFTCK